jgi:hypothetical protein
MERKKKKRRYTHSRGALNKARILNLLKKHWTTGFRLKEIIQLTSLSKPTAIRILQELLSEHKIFRLASLYFPEFDDDFRFGYFLSAYINFILATIMQKKRTTSNLTETPYNTELIAKDQLDNSIFAFSNAIGGLMTYALIKSSCLYNSDREPAKIKELINNIFKGLDWETIFYRFRNLFRNTRDDVQTTHDKKGSDRLSESLKNVYPILYETLETNRIEFFKEWIKNDPRDSRLYENCEHEWKERYMFGCGKYKECIHCHYRLR